MAQCEACDEPNCPGPGVLREYADWVDLSSHCSEEEILNFVNKHADNILRRNIYHKRQQIKKKLLAKAARRLLDTDELERIERLAEEQAIERSLE